MDTWILSDTWLRHVLQDTGYSGYNCIADTAVLHIQHIPLYCEVLRIHGYLGMHYTYGHMQRGCAARAAQRRGCLKRLCVIIVSSLLPSSASGSYAKSFSELLSE